MDIGHRMKELRIQYGLTQQELADRSELSKGFISQLERGLTTPSIGTLLDIIQCLGTTPAEFFTEDYFEKNYKKRKCRIEWLIPNAQKNTMEPVLLTLAPGGKSETLAPKESEEFGYILKGSVRLHYGTRTYIVHEGESFYFTAAKKHYIEACQEEASLIWISNPPCF